MTKDRERTSHALPNNNPFGLSDEAMKRLLEESTEAGERISKFNEESEKRLKELVLYCPYDNSPSRYIGHKGTYTIAWPVFKCEQEGHEFPRSQGKTSSSDK
ncbi:MAG: hypothetical protein Q7S39_12295 [Ignavibacteria bacterium]|nr:hypothetical protein [Ignavibacteria bacterium]